MLTYVRDDIPLVRVHLVYVKVNDTSVAMNSIPTKVLNINVHIHVMLPAQTYFRINKIQEIENARSVSVRNELDFTLRNL